MRLLTLLVALGSAAAAAQPIEFQELGGPYYRDLVLAELSDGTQLGRLRFGGLVRTTGDGSTWEDLTSAPDNVWRLAVLPDDAILLSAAGTYGEGAGLFRSEDRGDTWVNVGPPELQSSARLAVNAAGDRWAAAVGGDVFLTTDAGATWTTHPPTLDDDGIIAIAFDGQDRLLVARYNEDAVNSTVERFDGAGWTEAQTPRGAADNVKRLTRLPDGRLAAISYFYQSPIFSWFQRRPALYLSDDGGASWDRIGDDRLVDVTQRPDGGLVIARPSGIDGAGVPLPVPALAGVWTTSGGTLYAYSPRAGSYRLRPGAEAWEQVGFEAAGLPLAEAEGRLVAGGDGVLVVHEDGAWRPVPSTMERVVALDATRSGRLLVSTQTGLYAVDRLGEAPEPLSICAGEPCVARGVVETPTGALLAAAGCGLYRSTDDGDSWAQVLDGVNVRRPSAGPGLALAGHATSAVDGCPSTEERGLYASTDDGLTWTRRETGIQDLRGGRTFVTSDGAGYAGTYSGLYRLATSGGWDRLGDQQPYGFGEWNGRVLVGTLDGLAEVSGTSVERVGLDTEAVYGFVVRDSGALVATTTAGAVEARLATASSPDIPRSGVEITPRGPNPARGRIRLSVATEAAELEVTVFDALGRQVVVLHDGPGRGEVAVSWDPPAAGVYVVRARTPYDHTSHTVTVVR